MVYPAIERSRQGASSRPIWVALVGAMLVGGCDAAPEADIAHPRAAAVSAEGSHPVLINHAYTVLPPATYRALRDSRWLATEFASVGEHTTVRPDITYTGLYLLFERTYLELFPVSPEFPVEMGALALSDETAGGMAWVTSRMITTFGQEAVQTETISRTVDGQAIPWFHAAAPLVFSDRFSIWNMEFVTRPGAARPPTRQESLVSLYEPGKLARNIVAVAYALAPADAHNLRRLLAALGWAASEVAGGRFVALSPLDGGARRAVVVQPATETCNGITAVGIAMSRHVDHVEPLGDARLVAGILGRKLAILWLRPASCGDHIQRVLERLGG